MISSWGTLYGRRGGNHRQAWARRLLRVHLIPAHHCRGLAASFNEWWDVKNEFGHALLVFPPGFHFTNCFAN